MTSRDFAFWLQGFFEVANPSTIGTAETKLIKQHLNLVFKHDIDPSMGDEKHQAELNEIHSQPVFGSTKFPSNDTEAELKWGPKPSPEHVFNIHGWYHPAEGQPRC